MGLFRPYQRTDQVPATPEPVAPAPDEPRNTRKAVPTPTRKEAEAARRERLHPTLSASEQRKQDRVARAKGREEQFAKAEDQPGRVLLRDFLDSRKGMAQWWMPVIIACLALALALMYTSSEIALAATFVPYVALALLAVHITVLWRQFKKLLAERLPNEPARGLLTYLINRIIALRRFRTPPPRVKPGDQI